MQNWNCVYDSTCNYPHAIKDIEWQDSLSNSRYFIARTTGNDPILYLDDVLFISDREYVLYVDASSQDPNWQVYYILSDEIGYTDQHYIAFSVAETGKNDKKLVVKLPSLSGVKRLRIDPGSHSNCIFLIRNIMILESQLSITKFNTIQTKRSNDSICELYHSLPFLFNNLSCANFMPHTLIMSYNPIFSKSLLDIYILLHIKLF